MKTRALSLWPLLLLCLLAGCPKPKPTGQVVPIIPAPKPDYDRPLPAGELALRKLTDPRMIPDFTTACANVGRLREAIARSLNYLSKPSSGRHFPYGEITHAHGTYVYPDSSASGLGDDPQHLYTVKFDAADLWGDEPGAANTVLHIDLWEPYLTTP